MKYLDGDVRFYDNYNLKSIDGEPLLKDEQLVIKLGYMYRKGLV